MRRLKLQHQEEVDELNASMGQWQEWCEHRSTGESGYCHHSGVSHFESNDLKCL